MAPGRNQAVDTGRQDLAHQGFSPRAADHPGALGGPVIGRDIIQDPGFAAVYSHRVGAGIGGGGDGGGRGQDHVVAMPQGLDQDPGLPPEQNVPGLVSGIQVEGHRSAGVGPEGVIPGGQHPHRILRKVDGEVGRTVAPDRVAVGIALDADDHGRGRQPDGVAGARGSKQFELGGLQGGKTKKQQQYNQK